MVAPGVVLGATRRPRHRLREAGGEGVVDAVLHQDAVGADAGLAGVAELAGQGAGHRLIEIGVVEHDEGGVAAQLQAQPLDGVGGLAHQQRAHAGRSGEGDLGDHGVAGQLAPMASGRPVTTFSTPFGSPARSASSASASAE